MRRLAAVCAAFSLSLASCDGDSVAGKTTTTTNGGGGLVATDASGAPVPGCRAFAARAWDSASGLPVRVDTLRADSLGIVHLPSERYAFVELRDPLGRRGAILRRVEVVDGIRRTVALDTLRAFRGGWPEGGGAASSTRLYVDSSMESSSVSRDGSFAFDALPSGRWDLRASEAGGSRPMGRVEIGDGGARYTGSANLVLQDDPTGSPFVLDDFESGTNLPRIHDSYPGCSPWYMWWVLATMVRPTSSEAASFLQAVGTDSDRAGRSFHARFAATDPNGWVALGVTGLELDLSARGQVCFSYRADTLVKLQFQRDSVGGVRPTMSSQVRSSATWRDACLPFASFVPDADTPDSLRSWSSFGKRVLVIEFQVPAGGTFLDLDDIFVR